MAREHIPRTIQPKEVSAQQRRTLVLELRKRGMKFRTIVQVVRDQIEDEFIPATYDETFARQDVARELGRLRKSAQEDAEELRQLQLERYNELLAGVWSRARGTGDQMPSYRAIDKALEIMDRINKLTGLERSIIELQDRRPSTIKIVKGIDVEALKEPPDSETMYEQGEAQDAVYSMVEDDDGADRPPE